ncbi:hypothetical protein [Pantoea agglomerans]|uniref:phosphorylase family protein n=1 Tax=Enterobacter agglomerans TaxID=549 RepID=UPI003C7CD763
MKILIVDDSYPKVEIIASGIKLAGLGLNVITHCSNSSDALHEMAGAKYDILFLDLQLPISLGETIEEDGGVNLLELIDLNESISKPTHIVAITSHESSYQRYKSFFNERGWVILYSDLSKEIVKTIIVERIRTNSFPTEIDVVIITALEHIELENVLRYPIDWKLIMFPDDPSIYHFAKIDLKSDLTKNVLAVSSGRMGLVYAAALSAKIQIKFKPDYIFMSGICAGVADKTQLGDIIIADLVWDWGNGKAIKVEGNPSHLPSPYQISLDNKTRSKLMRLCVEKKYLKEIYENFSKGNRPQHHLSAGIGPMASGAVVIQDEDIVERIKASHRDLLAVEMEAYGVMAGPQIASDHPAKVIIVKSVCDFANLAKDNEWQEYAAYTSSQYIFKLIVNEIF